MNFIAYDLAGKSDKMKIYECRKNEMFDFFNSSILHYYLLKFQWNLLL